MVFSCFFDRKMKYTSVKSQTAQATGVSVADSR